MQRRERRNAATMVGGGARWSADDAQQILDEWAASGESLQGFAARRGLVPQRLAWWRKRLTAKPPAAAAIAAAPTAAKFLPVMVRAVAGDAAPATIEVAGGLRVELRVLDEGSAVWVARLVQALGTAP